MRKFESSQKVESRANSADSSKAYRKPFRVFNSDQNHCNYIVVNSYLFCCNPILMNSYLFTEKPRTRQTLNHLIPQ